jgi:aquaporin Z
MKKYLVEFIGTACLVLIGCGSATIANLGGVLGGGQGFAPLAALPIAIAFGIAVTAMAYAIGPISGCHINPAVTIGAWTAGRMPTTEVPGYIIAQVLGAIVGAALLLMILSNKGGGWDVAQAGLGHNGWGPKYLSEYSAFGALLVEFVATFIFVMVILGVTQKQGGSPVVAGLVIGLTLMVIHVTFIPVTGVSVNPARSIGPALFVGGNALAQLWLFIIAPIAGAVVAGLAFKSKVFEAE